MGVFELRGRRTQVVIKRSLFCGWKENVIKAYLGDTVGSVADCHSEASIAIKWVVIFFG